ncbi:MAG: sodium:solute symporter family protein [Saprospiraceae bacterium]|nr:sodium:solute symporter family protein [Saprospiraceae bacterium]
MKLHFLDFAIIGIYLLVIIYIGLRMRRQAQSSKEDYLMGGKSLPWYMLGLSNAHDMFDISGTMWMVTILFVYGLKSVWLPWLWPSFNQIFLMIFLSGWLRRSNAATGAEWIHSRFGQGRGVAQSHAVVVAFALIGCLGFLAYGFIGLGKFVEIFLPWEYVAPYLPFEIAPKWVAHFYGIIFTLFAVFYSILGGMKGIVLGDVVMYAIMTVSAFCVGGIAMYHLNGNNLPVPADWYTLGFGWNMNMDWTAIIPAVNQKVAEDGYSLFGLLFMMMVFKGVLASLAGPAPNYDMQKILSTKSPQEASKMSGFVSVVLLPVRYTMVTGFAVLALLFYDQMNLSAVDAKGSTFIDFERILPAAINNLIPTGLLGLILTGLIAAFMGTFSGTLNAAQSYIVNDIYLKHINPKAGHRSILTMNYGSGLAVVLISFVLGFYAGSVESILQWIVGGLYGGYVAANVFKWYWWRFNASGFFWGMATGIVAALALPTLMASFPDIFTQKLPIFYFPLLLAFSLIGCLAGTLLNPPTEMSTLKSFYAQVRPWGFWGPVYDAVKADDPTFQKNLNFGKDMSNVLVGILAQISMTVLPIYFILGKWSSTLFVVLILIACTVILKRRWWDPLHA